MALAKERQVALVIVETEKPLVDGLSDLMMASNIPCFGPSAWEIQTENGITHKNFFRYTRNLKTTVLSSTRNINFGTSKTKNGSAHTQRKLVLKF